MAKKIPFRKCVGCNERKPKHELLRVVYNKNTNKITIDKNGKVSGRGAYICLNKNCLEKARKFKKINRSLKISISDDIYDNLIKEIDIMKG